MQVANRESYSLSLAEIHKHIKTRGSVPDLDYRRWLLRECRLLFGNTWEGNMTKTRMTNTNDLAVTRQRHDLDLHDPP
ncbi:hypothetical protein RSOLAG1IB_12585 [Rhizoctonia solani AG-1 IB]|uniref:Uncharacterized protein n=1 Tax=Thanatephorus cucumeris (strain AG1-IB / isolate 7/3/14) TaxID=1108050 RepID=A0A0B7FYQ0_THACB|nr:hypothetical protein RSOLAG1IB_12585 [Rhizoctonia solani AG-1 IB]